MEHRQQEELLQAEPAPAVRPAAATPALQGAVGNRASAALLSIDFRQSRPTSAMSAPAVQLVARGGAGNQAIAALMSASTSAATDGRGLAAGDTEVDDRLTGALIGGGIGLVVGGVGGAIVGAGIGALAGGSDAAAAPVPVAVRNGSGHTPIDTADQAGMAIDITLTSSSGVDADMAAVQDSEQVSASMNHTGSYAHLPSSRSSNSGYMAGYPIPADRHAEPKSKIIDCADNHGGDGAMDREQLDTFMAPAAGITTATAIPNSGYLIRRIITVVGTTIKFRLHKSPKAVTVNGFTSEAGPSSAQSDEVTVRP